MQCYTVLYSAEDEQHSPVYAAGPGYKRDPVTGGYSAVLCAGNWQGTAIKAHPRYFCHLERPTTPNVLTSRA